MCAWSALLANLFSNGIGLSPVATGALPELKYQYTASGTMMIPITRPARKVFNRLSPDVFLASDKLLTAKWQIIILPMRSVLRLLWIASLLLIVALVSALTAMRYAIHVREVRVPDMQGKTPPEARRLAEDNGLEADVEREYYSPKIPEGRILSQVPAAGTIVRRGWQVRLALSLGPQRVTIPQVVGESQRAAMINIAQRGLALGATAMVELPAVPTGDVIAQNPPANASDASAPKISLLVAQPPPPQSFVMPSFIGQPLGSITNSLKDAGLTVGKVTLAPPVNPATSASHSGTSQPPVPTPSAPAPPNAVPNSPSATSLIVSQDPAPGAKAVAGSTISFVVR